MQIPNKNTQQSQWHLLPITGSSETDVQQKSIALTRYTQQYPQVSLNKIASLLSQEDKAGTFRKAVVVNSASFLTEQLVASSFEGIAHKARTQTSRVVFMFPGIGDHYVQMGRGLYDAIPYFRELFDQCDAELRPYLSDSLVDLLYPQDSPQQTESSGFDLASMLGRKQTANENNTTPADRLQETIIAHPLVFSIEYALAKLLQHWGIQPHALIGYSLGEYVAATISGVLTLKDALALVAQRAQLIQKLPLGKMLVAPLSKTKILPYLNEQVSLSAHNGDALTILAGNTDAVLAVQEQLLGQQIACRLLDTTHAFHSHMMEDAVDELNQLAQSITYAPPNIPYLSNVTGTWITSRQVTDPTYWAKHMCQPVQYFEMVRNLLGQEQTYQLIEIGPGQSLGSFVKQHPQCKYDQYALIHPTLRYSYDQQDDHQFLLSTIQKLWLSGVDLQWDSVLPDYSDLLATEQGPPLKFTSPQVSPRQATSQKDRGEKRRQNRLRRRKRISG